ncbi:hypothetical protein [Burkholderia sp. TSV86]|uniref:hypothetical protein n=1 Tax=Burkholderia sp. TSV86 TaxID=1385594 RepID=UPI0012E36DFC|nr:hypothetical protein [Burkholderia sp. TSV86]
MTTYQEEIGNEPRNRAAGGRGGAGGVAAIDRRLSALWPASYGLYHPLAAIGMVASLPLVVYLITRR